MVPWGTGTLRPHFPLPEAQPEAKDFMTRVSLPRANTVAFSWFQAPSESGRSGSRAGCGVREGFSRPLSLGGCPQDSLQRSLEVLEKVCQVLCVLAPAWPG